MEATLVALMILGLGAPALAAPPSPVGHWVGRVTVKGAALPVELDVSKTSAALQGRFSAPSQGILDYPLDTVSQNDDAVRLVLGGDTVFDGRLAGQELSGAYKGGEGDGVFHLDRVAAPPPRTRVTEVSFDSEGVRLHGSIVAPDSPGRHPAAVIVHGSGPQTRWGTNRFLAERLARAGVVALIYDKRGSGESGGDWKTADFDDLAEDSLAALAVLKRRPDVDPAHIGIVGHSQGGIIAAVAAARAPSDVAFVVAEDTVAGPVWRQDIYRTRQALQQDFTPAQTEQAMALYGLFVDVARGVRPYADFAAASAKAQHEPWFDWLGLPPQESWIWNWARRTSNVDTLDSWRKLRSPVLLVFGEHDQLVPVTESIEAIQAALDAAGAPHVAVIVPRAEHNLTIHPVKGEPFFWWKAAPGLDDLVADWIAGQHAGRPGAGGALRPPTPPAHTAGSCAP